MSDLTELYVDKIWETCYRLGGVTGVKIFFTFKQMGSKNLPAMNFKKPVLLLLIIFIGLKIHANPDSLLAVELCQKSVKIVYTDKDSALYYGYEALKLAHRLDRKNLKAYAHNVIGIAHDVSTVFDSALVHYQMAFGFAEENGNRITAASALNNIGLTCWNMYKYDEAIDYFNQSIVRFEELDNHNGIGNTLNNISMILAQQGRIEEAIEYNRNAIKRFKLDEEGEYGISASYANMGNVFSEIDQIDSCIYYLTKAIDYKEGIEDHYGLGISYHNLGAIYHEKEINQDSAIYFLNQSIKNAAIVNDQKRVIVSYASLGNVYESLNNITAAKENYQQAIDLGKKENLLGQYYRAGYKLGKILKEEGKYQAASPLFEAAYEAHDSIYSAERDEKILEITEKYESEKTKKELLESKSIATENALKVSNRNKWLFGLTASLIALIFFGLYRSQQSRRKAQAEKDEALLKEKDRGLKAVISAQEEERKRIAKDLHDGIGQQLAGLKMAWEKLSEDVASASPAVKERLINLSNILGESVSEVRSISHQMMPKALQELGLVPAVSDMLEKTFLYSEFKYSFDQFRAEQRFDEHIEISLYRICQELINNCVKHSGASEVNVQINYQAPFLHLLVEDNGSGIKEGAASDGIGMLNINSRLDAVNGNISFENNPMGGTVAAVRIRATPIEKMEIRA